MTTFLSVIVPTCQRNNLLAKCLDCLRPESQSISPDLYEVIVTDDGTSETAEQLVATSYRWARWLNGPKRGPAANRNHGAKHANGQWLVFVDDDCLPDRGWLSAIYEATKLSAVEIVEGRTIIPDKVDNPFLRGVENISGGLYWSCNLAVKKQTFERLGSFDEDFLEAGGEDLEFAWRFQNQKVSARFCENALVLHPVRCLSFGDLLWRARLYRWMALYYHKTGQAVPLSESSVKSLWVLSCRETTNLLRRTWHSLSRDHLPSGQSPYWRVKLFDQLWDWVSFPFVLANLLLWEIRFRRLQSNRNSR